MFCVGNSTVSHQSLLPTSCEMCQVSLDDHCERNKICLLCSKILTELLVDITLLILERKETLINSYKENQDDRWYLFLSGIVSK